MDNIFNDILKSVDREVEYWKERDSLKNLKKKVKDLPPTNKISEALKSGGFGLIAEIKYKSPSMGNMTLEREKVDRAYISYEQHPVVRAISVITNETYFGTSPRTLKEVRRKVRKPILRKDFIYSEYQIYQSRAIGADAILLMTNVVSERSKMCELHNLANDLGLEVICEVHSKNDLDLLPPDVEIIGINSRNFHNDRRFRLSRFSSKISWGWDTSTNINNFKLFNDLPDSGLKIAESGIFPDAIPRILRNWRFDGALVGSSLLKNNIGVDVVLNKFANEVDKFNQRNAISSNDLVGV